MYSIYLVLSSLCAAMLFAAYSAVPAIADSEAAMPKESTSSTEELRVVLLGCCVQVPQALSASAR